jgi:hypothetical protein
MAEDIKFEGRLWAIVGDGQKQYIGRVDKPQEHAPDGDDTDDVCPPYIELCPCYEFMSLTKMMNFPDGSSSPVREVMVLPVDKCKFDVRKRFRPTSLTWAEDIHENDRGLYRNLIRDLRQQAQEAREQESGIARPPPGFDPSKMSPPPGGFVGGGGFGFRP